MSRLPIELGSIVLSKAGRDQGRMFLVVQEVDSEFVMVANGKLRTMDRLKKKRRKHLKSTGIVADELRSRISEGKQIDDHEVRSWLNKEE